MESEFTLTTEEIWKNVIRTVESAYCWLLTYEGKDYELVEDTITSMRKLITHGKTYEDMKNYNSNKLLKEPAKVVPYKKHHYSFTPISYELESNWQQKDEHTIQVDLGNGEQALAISISHEDQLEQVIKDIYSATCVAVDCEFLGLKKSLPELKLLQIGVSKEKGYAIQVDIIGANVIVDKLKPVLEDQKLNIVGWAFRGDALAIESYIPGIELAPVLDLQAKLYPIAVENLNLSNALNRFASEWVGNTEFQRAKQYGNQFIFTGKDCVWLIHPLPPKALVYSVFDVLSVVALYEYTLQYPSDENFYWPFTVTSTSSRKSLDKWHVQRAKGMHNNNNQGIVHIVTPSVKSNRDKGKSNKVSSSPINDGYDDDDARYQRDLQMALERSVKDNLNANKSKSGQSSGGDRVVSAETEELNYSELAQDLDASTYKNKPRFSDTPIIDSTLPEIDEGSWGTESLDDQPFFGSVFSQKNTPTILKRPLSSSIQKSEKTHLPQGSNSAPMAAETLANKQWRKDTVEQSPPANEQWQNASVFESSNKQQWKNETKANKQWKSSSGTALKGQWNTNDTLKHQWKVNDTVHEEESKNNSFHNKQWNNSPKKWGDNHNTTSANSQWTNTNIGSPNQWGDSHALTSGNKHRNNNTGYSSPKTSEAQMSLTPSASTKSPNSVSSPISSPGKNGRSISTSGNNYRSPQPPSCKPDKTKYINDLKSRITTGGQTASFTWQPSTKTEMSSASWKSFVNSTISDWKDGKDTTIDAIENPTEDTNPTPEPIKFNTTVQSNYPRGGDIGDSSTGKMNELDSWAHPEDRPDTMLMPMNQIPIRTKFNGPKVTNPNDEMANQSDEDDDNDDDDDDDENPYRDDSFPILKVNMSIQDKSHTKKIQGLETLPTFVDGIFLYSEEGDADLSMFRLTKPEHLDMINIPPPGTDYTATICYHFISSGGKKILKAIQIYLSTGESYTAIIEKTFRMKVPGVLKNTKFGKLLTDPSIKRVCWCPALLEEYMYNILGFALGPCIDLMHRANHNRPEQKALSFVAAINHFLTNWPDKQQFFEAKADFEALNAKKFSSTCWDKEKLPDAVLTYCALQGLAAYTLYQQTIREIDVPDDCFLYQSEI